MFQTGSGIGGRSPAQLCITIHATLLVLRSRARKTSKWNRIEHRVFSFISLTWKGQPLWNLETVINLIGATRTRTGLRVKAVLDTKKYETGVKPSAEEIEKLRIHRHKINPAWNYTIFCRNE